MPLCFFVGFGLLVGENKQFEDITLGSGKLWQAFSLFYDIWLQRLINKVAWLARFKTRMVKIEAVEAETSWLLIPNMSQATKTLDPTVSI